MTFCRRFTAPVGVLLSVLLLVACGTQAPSSAAPTPSGTSAPADEPASIAAFNDAICPLFSEIIELDPRLAAMREAGAAGGDMSPHADEIDALGSELLLILNDLEAVPEWTGGSSLRFNLINALHGVRAQLLRAGDDPAAASAAETLAGIPFITSDSMDRAMQRAVEAGLTCGDGS